MYPRLLDELQGGRMPRLEKFILNENGQREDVSDKGAFPCGTRLIISASVPRSLGILAVTLRIKKDGENADRDVPLCFDAVRGDADTYSAELDTALLCKDQDHGLFYYQFIFTLRNGTVLTDSVDNVRFDLTEDGGSCFRMLVYKKDFTTPDWFKGGIMYQIFVDRFFKGEGEVESRADVIMNDDWQNGIPQYAEKNGDPLKNNMFFGGNLWGVAEKLDYLKSLGVTSIYLCPIFKAYSNHKYDTGDYETVDGMFGGDRAFDTLIEKARERGIRIILDGVFNHTGDNSRYFNRYKTYGDGGAYNSTDDPYYTWYTFKNWNEDYEAWWGIEILPRLNHGCPECRHYFTGENGIAQKYIDRGIGGWRLDVADELSDSFLDELRATVKQASNGEALIIGEVWENAADKSSYGKRRRYLRGAQLDSVMNYPLKNALIDYVRYGSAEILDATLTEIWSSYPEQVCHALMNIIGTHDTERILTVLGGEDGTGKSNAELSVKKLDKNSRFTAVRLLKEISAIQFTVYGVPSIYYGDEIGLEGYHDPFCRRPFPWESMDTDILSHYKVLGAIRARYGVFERGRYLTLASVRGLFAFERSLGEQGVVTVSNSGDRPENLSFLKDYFEIHGCESADHFIDLLTGEKFKPISLLEPDRSVILVPATEQNQAFSDELDDIRGEMRQ